MPTYVFLNTETGEEFESFMKISEREKYLSTSPHIQPVVSAPAIVSGVSVSKQYRVPSGFNDVLAKVAEAHPSSELAKRHGRKSIKQVRTQQLSDSHVKRVSNI